MKAVRCTLMELGVGPHWFSTIVLGAYNAEEGQLKYWKDILTDAELALQIRDFNDEERASWTAHIAQLRELARRAYADLDTEEWARLVAGEGSSMNPERYWRNIINKYESRAKEQQEVEEAAERDAEHDAAVAEAVAEMCAENGRNEE